MIYQSCKVDPSRRPRTVGKAQLPSGETTPANPGKLLCMNPSMVSQIVLALQSVASLELAMVFGSVANGSARMSSDLDLAVRYAKPLDVAQKLALIEALANVSGRAIDLIDLTSAGPIVAREALTRGKRIFGTDEAWASQTTRTLIDYADFAPLIERTLRERREAWTRT